MTDKQRIIIGVTGASGTILAMQLLKALRALPVEIHLVITEAARTTMAYETDLTAEDLESLAHVVYKNRDIAAPIASGSYRTAGMIIAPCSIKTMSEVAYGMASSLIVRAADVVLKERRRLVLVVRETPLHAGHLEAMLKLTHMGAIIAPPVPAFYAKPATIEDMVCQSMGRVLDLFSLDSKTAFRWE